MHEGDTGGWWNRNFVWIVMDLWRRIGWMREDARSLVDTVVDAGSWFLMCRSG